MTNLIAGVVTLAVLRSVIGGFAIFGAILFGLGALALWMYRTFWTAPAASTL